ncbi:hypothetical protein L596_022697 [Steinernema carpocapsae]|uniref:Uncharacterized protein n=1 Tax=Steinernema carpocapsae TaxID=34508 RepID=A0A4U5MMJ3_STECR|nr:hypothetical protein L596_022697 [Steinernema carpocapsae]
MTSIGAVLFLLCFVENSLGLDAATTSPDSFTRPKFVACSNETSVSTKGVFMAATSLNEDSGESDWYRFPTEAENCSFEAVSSVCRSHFPTTAYASALNETVEVPIREFVQNASQGFWARNKTSTMNKYECKEYQPVTIFRPVSSNWSERLHVGSDIDSKCLSIEEWIEIATKECGAKPLAQKYGGQCGKTFIYVEMVFLCDQPKKKLTPTNTSKEHEENTEYHHKRLFETIQLYAKTVQNAKKAKDNNLIYEEAALQRDLIILQYKTLMDVGTHSNVPLTSAPLTSATETFFKNHKYHRSEDVLSVIRTSMYHSMPHRSMILAQLAFKLLNNETFEDEANHTAKFDVGGNQYKFFKILVITYPELEDQIHEMYVDYMKKHTPGIAPEHLNFMGEPGAHKKIVEMYREIFNPGLINRKYLEKPWRSYVLSICAGVVVVGAILGVAVMGYRTRQDRIGIMEARFKRFANEDENLVEVYVEQAEEAQEIINN